MGERKVGHLSLEAGNLPVHRASFHVGRGTDPAEYLEMDRPAARVQLGLPYFETCVVVVVVAGAAAAAFAVAFVAAVVASAASRSDPE